MGAAERQLRPEPSVRRYCSPPSWPPPAKSPSPSTPPTARSPGAFEGETVTRRRFMTLTAHGAGAVAAPRSRCPRSASPSAPRSSSARRCAGSRSAARTTSRTTPTCRKVITMTRGHRRGRQDHGLHARPQRRDRRAARTRRATTSSSSRSPRAACTSAARCATSRPPKRFICPCHGGVYDFAGLVAGGPPVRPLDRFYTRVAQRPASRSARATRSTPSSSASTPTAIPASRSTASASTSTRRRFSTPKLSTP